MKRVLIVTFILLGLASCGAAQSPYDGDCMTSTCNGHMMPGGGGGVGGM
jgi:hypothetical protein